MKIVCADIGGTHARFGFYNKNKLTHAKSFYCKDFQTPIELITSYIKELDSTPDALMIAAAGCVHSGSVKWTNRPTWKLSEKILKRKYHLKYAKVVNDVYAQAYALKPLPKQSYLFMNIGTGLGSCVILNGQIFPCEFGQVLDESHKRTEDTLSAKGVIRLFHQFGGEKSIQSAIEIDRLRPKNKIATKAYSEFYQLWGKVAADITTGLLLTNGVYLWGGLIPRNSKDLLDFTKTYQKHTQKSLCKRQPIHILKTQNLPFKGLLLLFQREFSRSSK